MLKIIHLFGVAIFLGNIIVTGVWKVCADQTKNSQIIGFAQRLVTLTDWVFTAGGVVLILFGGFGMALTAGYRFDEGWLSLGLWIFIASGLIWIAILIPIQMKQAKLAHEFENGGDIPGVYWRLGRHWIIWGILATLVPMFNLYVMIVKP